MNGMQSFDQTNEEYQKRIEDDNQNTLKIWRKQHGITCVPVEEQDEEGIIGIERKKQVSNGRLRPVCRKDFCPQFTWKLGLCAKHYRWSRPCSILGCPDPMGPDGRQVRGFPICKNHLTYARKNPVILEDL
jgi:hypothetical protein